MSRYIRELKSQSATLIDTNNDKIVAFFNIHSYDNDIQKMREACNTHWDLLEKQDNGDTNPCSLFRRKESPNELILINKLNPKDKHIFRLSDYKSKDLMYKACNLLWDQLELKK